MFSIPWNLNLEKAARNLDSQHIPNTWEARAWSEHIWLSKIEMDKMHTAFALPLMKQKHYQPRWKGACPKPRTRQKRATLTLIEGHGDLFSIPVWSERHITWLRCPLHVQRVTSSFFPKCIYIHHSTSQVLQHHHHRCHLPS